MQLDSDVDRRVASEKQKAPLNGDFTDRHRARLAATFVRVDELLTKATRALDLTALQSSFSKHVLDVTPMQQELIAEYAERIRATMAAMLARHRIALAPPAASALDAARTSLNRAVVAIEELGPNYLIADGPLSDDLDAELNRIVSQVLVRLEQMEDHLAQDSGGDLRYRLHRLSPNKGDTRPLHELARIIHVHRVAHLRAPLEALVDRFESDDVEIAVFGRTNAGKSSLLNYLMESDVLPVGAMPVTVVPVHIAYGPKPMGSVRFADAGPEVFVASRLPEFAADHFNPGNSRHVTHLRVETPARRLKDSIVLVDVPGLDFKAGPPAFNDTVRCDVGIVLVDASGGLALEETAIVDALHRSGSSVIVLLSKADRLQADERWRVHGHVSRALLAKTGIEVPVFFASTTSNDALLRDDWIDRGLGPVLRQRDKLRDASLDGKIALLQQAVGRALERRMALATATAKGHEAWNQAEATLSETQALLDVERDKRFDATAEANRQILALVNEVSHNAAVLWPQSHESSLDITTLLTASLQAKASGFATTVTKHLSKLRAQCCDALITVNATVGLPGTTTFLAKPRGSPLFDASQYIKTTVLSQAAFPFLGRWQRRNSARNRLARSVLRARMSDALTRHYLKIDEWRLGMIRELRDSLGARAIALRRTRIESTTAALERPSSEARLLADDIAKLRAYSRPSAVASTLAAYRTETADRSKN